MNKTAGKIISVVMIILGIITAIKLVLSLLASLDKGFDYSSIVGLITNGVLIFIFLATGFKLKQLNKVAKFDGDKNENFLEDFKLTKTEAGNSGKESIFKPPLFPGPIDSTIIFSILLTVFFALPLALILVTANPFTVTVPQNLIIVLLAIVIGWVFVIFILKHNVDTRRIEVSDNTLIISKKTSGVSWTSKRIELDKVAKIEYRLDTKVYFIPRTAIKNNSFFVIHYKDKKQEEISAPGWDLWTLKRVVSLLKSKYPTIDVYVYHKSKSLFGTRYTPL